VAIAPSPQDLFPDAVEEATARWVEGRVIFPEGSPDDDLLHVYSLSEFFEHDGFAERLFAIQHALREDVTRDPNEIEEVSIQRVSHALYARRPIEADGSFRVPVDPEAEEVFLMVEGRYLFTRVTEEVALGGDLGGEAPIELELLAGAQLVVQVAAPEEADLAGTEVETNIIRASMDQSDYDRALTLDTTVELFSDATFEFHAVPTNYGLQVDVKPEEWAASRVLVEELQPGETRRVEVELSRGGVVVGEVVDSDGAPVEGAQVEMMLRGNWFGFDDETVREGTTDELGRFEIARVTPGKLALKADHESFLESSRVSVEVFEGQTVEAKALKLTPGNSLSGRVVNEAGEAVPDVRVRARFDRAFLAGPSGFNALRGAEAETRTDEEGRFLLKALGAGPFIVQAVQGFDEEGKSIDPEDAETLYYARREKVYPKAKDLVLVLHPPIELSGVVTGGEENPVSAFTVVAIRESDGAMGKMPMETRQEVFESAPGTFTMSEMTEGAWKVQVR
ncbi:MAG: carboxypeptidase-like regulatory domain-containing protein, partial [Planctomycetota bacterium]